VFPDSANGFNGVQQWTVRSGAAIFNDQNQTFNANSISVEIDAGGLYDANFRGTGVVGSDTTTYTQTLGTLTGAGTITSGEKGNSGAQTLSIAGTNTTVRLTGNNSYNGTTTISDGAWLVDGTHTGGGTYTVNSGNGAMLGGSGSISASIVLNGGLLVAGDGGGTLTVNNVSGSGGDETIVSNANLTVNGQLTTTTLYLSNATLQLPLVSSGPTAVVSTLDNDGNVTLVYTSANPAVGDYPLISYQSIGGLAGGGTNGITLVAPSGTVAYLSNNVNNSSLDVVVSAVPALVWNGTPNGTWSIGGSDNWRNGATAVAYTETGGAGPFVSFSDTATGTTAVSLAATVSPKGITVNNSALSYTFSGTGAIGGTGGLLKEGTNVLVIANTGGNYFSGTLNIQAGEVRVGNGTPAGNLGTGPVVTGGQLTFNRSDSVTVTNVISGQGVLAKSSGGTAVLTEVTNYGGTVSINGGTLDFAPAQNVTISNNITGAGTLGVSGGLVILEGTGNTWSGGTVITNGTLQIGDQNNGGSLPGSVTNNGTLAFDSYLTVTNDLTGAGEVLVLSEGSITLAGADNYSGPTVVFGGSITAASANYPTNSTLTLGDQTGGTGVIGTANFTAGNPILPALNVGGNSANPSQVNLTGSSNQVLSINGNVSIGAATPSGATVEFQPTGTDVSVVINTNGGVFQIGLGNTSSGVNPDDVVVDFSQINNLIVNLGAGGALNLGTLDGNPGPQAGASVVNQLQLAAVSNFITASNITIGPGGRQLTPDLRLGPGANVFNVGAFDVGTGGRDGGQMEFYTGAGSVKIRGLTGGSTPAEYNQGVNATTGTAAGFTTTVDFTGGTADLLFDAMVIGNQPLRNAQSTASFGWANTFNFEQGTLIANSVSLSGGCLSGTTGASTMNITGGTAALGAVSLTASPASGTLNIAGQSGAYATVTVSNITYSTGVAALSLDWANFNVALGAAGNPATAPVTVGSFSASDTVNLGISGSNFTVGQFPLISYTGSIGGSGYSALTLASLPTGVGGYLSNNVNNLSVDVVITNAPRIINVNPTNLLYSVSGSTLNLSWPGDHEGWMLQSNSVSLAATNQWFAYLGSTNLTNVSITLSASQSNVFFRLVYP